MRSNITSLFTLLLIFVSFAGKSQNQCLDISYKGFATYCSISNAINDGKGNTIITGSFTDSAKIGNQLILSPSLNFFVAKIDSSQNLTWYKIFTHNVNTINIHCGIDISGDIILTGNFYDSINFDTTTFTTIQNWDIFIAKLNANTGSCIWLKKAGALGGDICQNMTLDKYGNVFITGAFHGYCQFGSITLVCTGTLSGFVAKYDSGGNAIWAKQIIEQSGMMSNDVTIDNEGNCVIVGYFFSTANFGNGIVLTTTGSNNDSFIAKYDTIGNILWAKQTTWFNTSSENFYKVRIDQNNNYYLLHQYPLALMKYSFSGDTLGSLLFSNYTNDLIIKENHIFIIGNYINTINFGNSVLNSTTTNSKVYIAEIDTLLNIHRLFGYETNNSLNMYEISSKIDTLNEVQFTGMYKCVSNTLTNDSVYNLPCNPSYNFFNAKNCSFTTLNQELPNKLTLLKAIPNPFNESCLLNFLNSKQEITTILIRNLLGQKINIFKTTNNTFTIFKGDLKSGMYLIDILNSENQSSRIKILIE